MELSVSCRHDDAAMLPKPYDGTMVFVQNNSVEEIRLVKAPSCLEASDEEVDRPPQRLQITPCSSSDLPNSTDSTRNSTISTGQTTTSSSRHHNYHYKNQKNTNSISTCLSKLVPVTALKTTTTTATGRPTTKTATTRSTMRSR